jgi:hypothetical protein
LRAFVRKYPVRFFSLLIIFGVVIILFVGCGAATDSEVDDFRRECEKDGGTYTNVQNDSPMCTYDSKKEQP